MKGELRPTMKTVAEKAGVSVMTVSLALRNHPSIPARTRLRIQKLAQQVNYQPHPLVSTLMTQIRSRRPVRFHSTLAFTTGFPTRDGWRGAYAFREYYEGSSRRAVELGYKLEEFWLKEPGLTGQRAGDILQHRGIRGLLIGPVRQSRGHLRLDWSRFAAVALGYSVWKPELNRVAPHHYQICTTAFRELKRRGYKRIGLALPAGSDERVNHAWLAGILVQQQRAAPRDRIPPLLISALNDQTFTRWFTKYRPDALMCISGTLVKQWLAHCGKQVPEDVGMVQLDWHEAMADYAGVIQNSHLVGVKAVDMIVGMLQRNETGIPAEPALMLVPSRWVDGKSIRDLRQRHRPR